MPRRVLAVCCAFLLAGCGSQSARKQEETIHSVAAEGALLAGDAVAGRSTRIFTREHSGYLRKTVATLQPSSDRRIARLAGRVARDLDRLGDASQAEQAAIARDLGAV